MSEDYLKLFTGVVLLIFVIIAGYFFSERNDRKMFLLSSLVFLVSKRLARTVLIFTERSDQLSRATDRVPGLPASPGYAQ